MPSQGFWGKTLKFCLIKLYFPVDGSIYSVFIFLKKKVKSLESMKEMLTEVHNIIFTTLFTSIYF